MEANNIQKQRAIETHSSQAGEFDDSYRGLGKDAYQTCFTYSRRRLEAMLEQYLPAPVDRSMPHRLLDVGCGTGHHMALLRSRGFDVAGVDGSVEMLEHARRHNPNAEIRQSDVEELPFESASFDYVLCVEVLRYLPRVERSIAEIARVLRPGGTALVTAAPLFSLNGYYFVNRLATMMPIGNLVRLKQFFSTSGGLEAAFERAGFENVEVKGVYSGPLNWIEHLAPGLLPGLLKEWEPIDARVADAPVLREFSNMFLVVGRKYH
jgi:ubiquinone/menaquinone biosynthesis C-methylase UbiE